MKTVQGLVGWKSFNKYRCLFFIFLSLLLAGCRTIKVSTKYSFEEGVYKIKTENPKPEKSYVILTEDTIIVHAVEKGKKVYAIDTVNSVKYSLHSQKQAPPWKNVSFSQKTFDVDLLTIFFKYRPAVSGFPNQMNTNFNGAVYLGYRSDKYLLSTSKTPLNMYQKKITHHGYSFGIFSGIGSTAVNPWVTKNKVNSEYDGVVFTNGLCAIIAINKLTFGLNLGVDWLLDKNHPAWIYRNQPWVGISLGLNIN